MFVISQLNSNPLIRATILLTIGFLLFFTGFISLILMLVGARFSFLAFIDAGGQTLGLVIRLIMTFGGLALAYVNRSKFEK